MVLTIPDVPPTLLQTATAAATYLPLTGGTLTGDLIVDKSTPAIGVRGGGGDTFNRVQINQAGLWMGSGFATWDTNLVRGGVGSFNCQAHFNPYNNATHDLGLVSQRWRNTHLSGSIQWGPGTAAADTTLQRTSAGALRLDNHLGVAVAPMPWGGAIRALQVAGGGSAAGDSASLSNFYLGCNTYHDGTAWKQIAAGANASSVSLNNGAFVYSNAPDTGGSGNTLTFTQRVTFSTGGAAFYIPVSVQGTVGGFVFYARDNAAMQWQWYSDQSGGAQLYNASPTFNGNRLQILPSGTLNAAVGATAGVDSITIPGSTVIAAAGQMQLDARSGGHIYVNPYSGYFLAISDNSKILGHPSVRWQTIYVMSAPVVGSSADLKEDIKPLDPAACVASVLETDWVKYTYKAPVFTAPEPTAETAYDEHDSNEVKAEKKAKRDAEEEASRAAHAKMVVETAVGRRQKGYVLSSPDHKVGAEFGLPDRMNRSDGADLAVVACALQNALTRIAQLEAAR